ncbi:MAG: YbaN family protein [Candidatus Lokiarchaeota archaeon]|nr:YbaN family protein [Candidatus Lokiarchaeota archaeon]
MATETDTKQDKSQDIKKKTLLNKLIFIGGTITLILGIIGIFLPILPTTPFLLISAAAYARSSSKFYHWLLHNKILGSYIRNYKEGLGMPIKVKIFTLSFLWIMIIIALFIVQILWIQFVLVVIALAVSIHVILIKPKKESEN